MTPKHIPTFNPDHPKRRALNGRQIERPNKLEVESNSGGRISRPFSTSNPADGCFSTKALRGNAL